MLVPYCQGPGIMMAVAPLEIPYWSGEDHLSIMWQYGTEISKPLFPIHVIYEYKYEYEESMNKIMSISASMKMRKFMLSYEFH